MKIDDAAAKLVIAEVFRGMDAINLSAKTVRERCSEEVFSVYQLKAAALISSIEDELLKPIYREHQHLRPY